MRKALLRACELRSYRGTAALEDTLKRCPICLTNHTDETNIVVLNTCKHFYCALCFDTLVGSKTQVECPMCRTPFDPRRETTSRKWEAYKLIVQAFPLASIAEKLHQLEYKSINPAFEKVLTHMQTGICGVYARFERVGGKILDSLIVEYKLDKRKSDKAVKVETTLSKIISNIIKALEADLKAKGVITREFLELIKDLPRQDNFLSKFIQKHTNMIASRVGPDYQAELPRLGAPDSDRPDGTPITYVQLSDGRFIECDRTRMTDPIKLEESEAATAEEYKDSAPTEEDDDAFLMSLPFANSEVARLDDEAEVAGVDDKPEVARVDDESEVERLRMVRLKLKGIGVDGSNAVHLRLQGAATKKNSGKPVRKRKSPETTLGKWISETYKDDTKKIAEIKKFVRQNDTFFLFHGWEEAPIKILEKFPLE